MNLKFDYYHNLETPDLYLCKPNGDELFVITGFDRKLTLRFNDLSELTFSCYEGADAYSYLETRRLVLAQDIGWFVITNVQETADGLKSYKSVTCESLQATFKDRGFYCEERVYYLYNPSDPYDEDYDADDDVSVPSVMGQLYQQLGVQQDLSQGKSDPATPYSNWTITYVNTTLNGTARSFKETTEFGYEWMVKDVEEAFGVIITFDFYYKTIHIILPSEATTQTNIVYSFANFMKEVDVTEDAENIVTVMNCNGDNCDITTVNPTGTNYICDFSYYIDAAGKWMSSELKAKLYKWNEDVEYIKPEYETTVLELQEAYANMTSIDSTLTEVSQIYTDLAAAVAQKSVAASDGTTASGIVWCETVNMGETSMDEDSVVHSTPLVKTRTITAYKTQPTYDSTTGLWTLSGSSHTDTIENCFEYIDSDNNRYLYFIDNSTGNSGENYCVLQGESKLNTTTYETEYVCKGLKRYTDLSIANEWMTKYDAKKATLQTSRATYEATAQARQAELQAIASGLDIISYLSTTPELLKELYCYWIEGDYTNENISVTDSTTPKEAIDLANELLDSGKTELAKVCQPKLQFSLTSADCTKVYEFRNQMKELELGKVIAVEVRDGTWYYPALLEMSYDLDNADSFTMSFANALRLDDWGYTYGDLMSDASTTSRQVSANWQNLVAYSNDKETISSLIQDPLSSALRSSFANMNNQEFLIDDTGILGRKFTNSSKNSFDDEQLRIINNVILFTDDNWDSVKTALGKVAYYDEEQQQYVYTYGLVAETIIGSLMMSEKLKIKNSDSSIVLDGSGITIKNGSTIVFTADTSGNLTVTGTVNATAGVIGGCTITNGELRVPSAYIDGTITATDLVVKDTDNKPLLQALGSSNVVNIANFKVTRSSVATSSDGALVNVVTSSGTNYYMTSPTDIPTDGGGNYVDGSYVYVGTDGIGLTQTSSTTESGTTYYTINKVSLQNGALTAKSLSITTDVIVGDTLMCDELQCLGYGSFADTLFADKQVQTPKILSTQNGGASITFDGSSTATTTITMSLSWLVSGAMRITISTGGATVASDASFTVYYKQSSSQAWSEAKTTTVTILEGDSSGYKDVGDSQTHYSTAAFYVGGSYVMTCTLETTTPQMTTYGGIQPTTNGTASVQYWHRNSSGNWTYEFSMTTSGYTMGGQNNNWAAVYGSYIKAGTLQASTSLISQHQYHLIPYMDAFLSIGNPGDGSAENPARRWNNLYLAGSIYCPNDEIQTSDRNKKHTITSLIEQNKYETLFDVLNPVTFKLNEGTSDRLHIGFIANEVAEAIQNSGLTTKDFAGYCSWKENGVETCGLRYGEFVALNTWQIQKLKARISELEEIVAQLQNKE